MNHYEESARRILHGHDGPVEIDLIRRTVAKTYLFPEHEAAVAMAIREVAFASRLRDALPASAGIACPRVIGCDLTPPPRIIMSLCPGEPLATFLGRIRRRDPRTGVIAGKIRDGLAIYTRLFDEPYYDLCFQNILYDEATGMLTLLDFGIPDGPHSRTWSGPLEASLGNLIGCACYSMVRPAHLFSRKGGHLQVMREVMAAFGSGVAQEPLLEIARATFRRLTDHGSAVRRAYYGTIGTVMSNTYLKEVLA